MSTRYWYPIILAAAITSVVATCGYHVFAQNYAGPTIDSLASVSRPPQVPTALASAHYEELYHTIWQLIQENSMHQEKLAEWATWENRFHGRLGTAGEYEHAIEQMIDSLQDEFTYFRNAASTRARELEYDQHNVVNAHMRPDNVAYIQIKSFTSRHTAEETEAALKMLSIANGYILDLRGNKGGSVDEAYRVFSLFVDKGLFCTMKGHLNGSTYSEVLNVTGTKMKTVINGTVSDKKRIANLTGSKPLLILVNNNTRSAAEMLAGALKEQRHARLLGTQTYGKGVVQNTWLLDDGTSVKVAIAFYYLPGGKCIHRVGITPDILVSAGDASDPQLSTAHTLVQKLHH